MRRVASMLKRTGFFFLLGLATMAAPSRLLFDGRLLDGQATLPGPSLADLPAVEAEVRRRHQEPYLQQLAPGAQVQQGSSEFLVRGGIPGSFTRVGARQRAFLYRLGLSSGLVVLENGAVVAHYNGVAGDYAHYIYARAVDLNGDGLSDLILNRNTEDSPAVESQVFTMTSQGPLFLGSSPVFTGSEEQAEAFVLSVLPGGTPRFSRDHYQRRAGGGWASKARAQVVALERRLPAGFEPKLLRLTPAGHPDQARIQVALGKLEHYSDVGSSIDDARPANPGQALVAADPGLRLMELLDTRAAMYAYENATKQEADHSSPQKFALALEGLTTREQIRAAYVRRSNDHLGGLSPYLEP